MAWSRIPKGQGFVLGPFRTIARRLFPSDEFQIDEKPFAVLEASLAGTSANGTNGAPDRENEGTPADAPPIPDVVTLLSEILAENSRLNEGRDKESPPDDPQQDEFAQFAPEVSAFIDAIESVLHLARTNDLPEAIEGWLDSVDSAYTRKLKPALEKHDLIIMDCIGQEVDFNIHDVIEYRRTKDHPHNTVIEERRKGILFRGRVMRDAKVVVACNE